ncbi:hypothetical protein X777_00454 [Ooceraea biroi]|uniref:Uncharacterized protein n=1 Tax=Ooceraea biroi TaxID=2015173 RepID=A0A026WTX4_OOCBI|nr:hypothetical protein X777_00454 [Ooceraea biroi]
MGRAHFEGYRFSASYLPGKKSLQCRIRDFLLRAISLKVGRSCGCTYIARPRLYKWMTLYELSITHK